MNRRSLILSVLLISTSACAQIHEVPPSADSPLSVRMAASVMERRPIVRERWDYETGTVLRGFEELWKRTGNESYFDYIKSNIDEYVAPDGSIRTYKIPDYNLDNINTGKLLFLLDEQTDDGRYRAAAETLHQQLVDQPTTSEGGYWHKQRYPFQMWLDGLYMAEPFAARYALTWGESSQTESSLDHVALQFQLAARYLRDPATGLFYHGWDEKHVQIWADSLTGRSANFWNRAVGWYAMALVDVLDFMPADHPQRDSIIRILQDLAEAVAHVQDPVTGTWFLVMDQPNQKGNYVEASGSCMFVYALAKGARMGYIDQKFLDVARRGYNGIIKEFVTVENGLVNLNQIVSVGGLGGDNNRDGSYDYYLSEPVVSNDPKGIGPFILASLEIEMASRN